MNEPAIDMLDDFWTQAGVIVAVLGVAVAVIALYFQIRNRDTGTIVQQAGRGAVQQLVINSPNTTIENRDIPTHPSDLLAFSHDKREPVAVVSHPTLPQRREILDNVLDDSSPLAPLVGKALLIAKELGRAEESRWLERELYGYEKIPDDQSTTFPEYRRIPGIVAVRMTGYSTSGPFDRTMKAERTIFVTFPISEIENRVTSARKNGSEEFIFWMPIPDDLVPPKKLGATITSERPGHAPFIVERGSLEKLLSSLRLGIHKFISTT